MSTLKIYLKGMLLWITAFIILLFLSGIDSIVNNGYFMPSFIVCTILCYACYMLISREEMEKITLYKWFNKLMEEE